MKFTLATALAFVSATFAQTAGFNAISKPTEGEKVPAGSTYEIVWQPTAEYPGTVAIELLGGASPKDLDVLDPIATGVDGSLGSYEWSVDESLGDLATYGIRITLEDDVSVFQYSFPFQIVASEDSDDEDDDSSSTSATETATETATDSTTVSITSTGEPTTATATLTTTMRGNLSTTATGGQTTFTSTRVVVPPSSTTTTATTSLATNGVASVAAGSFALFGGVAMAVLAL